MSINLVRYEQPSGTDAAWGVVAGDNVLPLPAEYNTTAEILGEGVKVARQMLAEDTKSEPLPLDSLRLLSPVTRPCRILAQGANFKTHLIENKMDPNRAFNMFFTKSSASMCGPSDDIVRPANVRLLDYEVELGIVLGKPITGPVTVTADELEDYIGAFVIANDVSARDVQLIELQWYKGKSYRTFCPVGPYLTVPDPGEVSRWGELRLHLEVNGTVRQNELASDMVFGPAETLTELSQIEDIDVGDLLITGTPGGVALKLPSAMAQRLAGLLPESRRWPMFVKSQLRTSGYLQSGDIVTAGISTPDGAFDLGTQRNIVRAL
ncbi:fumarylacetoacetate hydrolase family protein [Nocardia sp. CA2R105]|uniref:fumarylacetoacetate hydrolase family protein n=1 Tax=Nocardia coffeae TaxID=2873381 RepID=UPI001CA6BD87|nr:fumarylacetoacetate hydrolase family protein [Nocardia coffeae]MBY8863414.1 fumarylacetoacetate hydrolase family protein [Nocardia coffeae]